MTIRDADNWIEIEVVNRIGPDEPMPGDAKLSVAVSSSNFSGQGFAWVAAPKFAAFLQQLRELELHRQGSAELEGMSPGEFRLRIASINRRGHMAVTGLISKRIHSGESGPCQHSVEIGFEFDPTLLPKLLTRFAEIADGIGDVEKID